MLGDLLREAVDLDAFLDTAGRNGLGVTITAESFAVDDGEVRLDVACGAARCTVRKTWRDEDRGILMSSPLWEDVDRFLTITSANSARARLGYRPLRPIARSATGRGAVADGYERDEELSAEVLTYVGFDRDSAVPGRHLDRIADGQLRSRVKALISEVDSLPDGGSQDLFAWAEQRLGAIAEAHPELTDDALIALRALLSFEWH